MRHATVRKPALRNLVFSVRHSGPKTLWSALGLNALTGHPLVKISIHEPHSCTAQLDEGDATLLHETSDKPLRAPQSIRCRSNVQQWTSVVLDSGSIVRLEEWWDTRQVIHQHPPIHTWTYTDLWSGETTRVRTSSPDLHRPASNRGPWHSRLRGVSLAVWLLVTASLS